MKKSFSILASSRRIQQQPAWILHHRPFRDSSRLVDVLSRDHGRLSLVARGARQGKSRLKGLLRPFLPLQLSWVIRSDLGTLTGAEMNGRVATLSPDAMMSAYYLNELMLKLLHRHDPQPELFSAYSETMLALSDGDAIAVSLRRFELAMLRLLGYALTLESDAPLADGSVLQADNFYEYRVDQGPVRTTNQEGSMVFSGAELVAIGELGAVAKAGASRQVSDVDLAVVDPAIVKTAGRLLRQVIAWHLNGKELNSRRVWKAMRNTPSTAVGEAGNSQ